MLYGLSGSQVMTSGCSKNLFFLRYQLDLISTLPKTLKWVSIFPLHYNVLYEYIWFEILSFPSLMFLFLTYVSCRLVTILLWLLSKLWLLTIFPLLRADVLLTSKLYDSLLLTSQLYGSLPLVLSPCILLRLILYDCNSIFVLLSTKLKLNCIGLSIYG